MQQSTSAGLPVRIQTLGTGGPRPDPDRAGPATVVKIGDETLLFDAGRGVVVQMVRAGIALESLQDVFITHHHFDHIGDVFDVALSTWLHGRRHAIAFRGPPDTRRIMNALLTQVYDKDIEWRSDGEPTHGGWSTIDAVDVAPGLVAESGRWRVFAESVVHGHGLAFSQAFLKRWICYGYRVETQGKVIAISGDTVDCAGLRRLAKDADVLVQCCYLADAEINSDHFRNLARYTLACGDTVGKIATACNVGTLVLTHHCPRNDTAMVERLREEVARDFHGRLIIANDLDEITI